MRCAKHSEYLEHENTIHLTNSDFNIKYHFWMLILYKLIIFRSIILIYFNCNTIITIVNSNTWSIPFVSFAKGRTERQKATGETHD